MKSSEASELLKGRGDKVSSKRSRGGTKRRLKEDRKGTLRTKISWLSTAYIVCSSGEKEIREYKRDSSFDLFQV